MIYRFAYSSDFNSKSFCKGVDPLKNKVLFIGAEQRLVLIAPLLPSDSVESQRKQPTLMKNANRPEVLEVKNCDIS